MTSEPHNTAPIALLPLTTLVVWLLCATIGVLGLILPYTHPHPTTEEFAPTQAELLNVEIAKRPPIAEPQPAPADPAPAIPELATPTPQPPPPVALPDAPPVTPVAAPSPAVAFAVPTQGLTRIVDVNEAAHGATSVALPPTTGRAGSGAPARPGPPAAASQPAITRLTIGQGEGRQPLPEYPHEAALGGQEGTVTLRFAVGEDGRISSVQIISPSAWPLLNQAASRAVRETWHFPSGPRRIYEVPIQFQLHH